MGTGGLLGTSTALTPSLCRIRLPVVGGAFGGCGAYARGLLYRAEPVVNCSIRSCISLSLSAPSPLQAVTAPLWALEQPASVPVRSVVPTTGSNGVQWDAALSWRGIPLQTLLLGDRGGDSRHATRRYHCTIV